VITNTAIKERFPCSGTDLGDGNIIFECNIPMAYYDLNGSWNINVSVTDIAGNTAYNNAESFTYNQLNAFILNMTSINFGTLGVGQSNIQQFYLNNTGNLNLTSEIKGTDLINGSYSIGVSNLKWDLDSDPSDGTVMTASFIPIGSLITNSIQDIWTMLTIPSATYPLLYSGTIYIQS
jgi:hypothetical protein